MGYFYFDESIHDKGNFIIGAFIYSKNDLSQNISDILKKHGYNPDIDEFKSGINFTENPKMIEVRNDLKSLISGNCELGIIVIPIKERKKLGIEVLKGLKQFLIENKLNRFQHSVYFDEGIFDNVMEANNLVIKFGIESNNYHFEQDSKIIKGIQLADICAHTSSIMLLEVFGLVNKSVKAGENSGYVPDTDMNLGFEMWASIRYCLFHGQSIKEASDDPIKVMSFKVEPNGLFISDLCDKLLADKARERFGTVYLGCIH